ncbi:hypothetical protein [Hymenobacter jeollabukensis]|uniref:Uncharacterized protein n=1 Tax=Hymenobacter jeollabukensis TaxID=2025313 RepID=A0A5R8WUI9_9BACT|nr:hypothetical protein [Hymenobacter jeollabukensis]TLM95439.1 hypothetical protein FDY95_06530 [Hymenobacter jeollabukensis]
MNIVEYPRSLQWVGHLRCNHCQGLNEAWRSSGMSDCFPHFFCSRCSNVIHREADKAPIYAAGKVDADVLAQIAATLPYCPCGGRFTPGVGPTCGHCQQKIDLIKDPVQYLQNPNMVVMDGACAFSDERPPYQVRIVG